jgi:acetyl-CoA acyltransferase
MLAGAVPATRQVLAGAGLNVTHIDRFEVGEAFAPVVLGWERALEVDPSRVNVGGGGIALGEPTGSLGARLLVTLVHDLARAGGGMGIAATGGGGGLGAAVLVERP